MDVLTPRYATLTRSTAMTILVTGVASICRFRHVSRTNTWLIRWVKLKGCQNLGQILRTNQITQTQRKNSKRWIEKSKEYSTKQSNYWRLKKKSTRIYTWTWLTTSIYLKTLSTSLNLNAAVTKARFPFTLKRHTKWMQIFVCTYQWSTRSRMPNTIWRRSSINQCLSSGTLRGDISTKMNVCISAWSQRWVARSSLEQSQ